MSKIRAENTRPEMLIRSLLHRMGFRFRVHVRSLSGRPDVVLPKYRTVVFVHGCFWHRHQNCRFAYNPKSRVEFWQTKFQQNVARDRDVISQLQLAGWKVVIIWECEVTRLSDQPQELDKLIRG